MGSALVAPADIVDVRPEILDSALHWLPLGASSGLTIDLLAYFEKVLDC